VFRTEAGKVNAHVQLPARCGNRGRKELSRARFKSNRLDFFQKRALRLAGRRAISLNYRLFLDGGLASIDVAGW
jgi:hypothetical protein